MTELLNADLLRLRKSHLFWGTLALSFGFGAFMCVIRFREHLEYGFAVSLSSVFFGFAMVAGIVSPASASTSPASSPVSGRPRRSLPPTCWPVPQWAFPSSADLTCPLRPRRPP